MCLSTAAALLLVIAPLPLAAAPGPATARVSRIMLNGGSYEGMYPHKAVFDKKRNVYYVACAGSEEEILRFDPASRRLSRVFKLTGGVKDMLYDQQTDRLFVLTTYIKLLVLDPGNGFKVVKRWNAGGRPQQMAFDPSTRRLYVTAGGYGGRDAASAVLFVFHLDRSRHMRKMKIRGFLYAPTFLALDRARNRLYVASHMRSILRSIPRRQPSGHLAIIDARRFRIKRIIKLDINPAGMWYDEKHQQIVFKDSPGQIRSTRRMDRRKVLAEWRKAMQEAYTLTIIKLPKGKAVKMLMPPFLPIASLHTGYYDPRDGTLNFVISRESDFILLKVRADPDQERYDIVHKRTLSGMGSGMGYMEPGPARNQALLSMSGLRMLSIVDFGSSKVVHTPTGYRIGDLAANRKKGLVYGLDGNAGRLLVIDAKSGRIRRWTQVPLRSKRIIVNEKLSFVGVVADHKMPSRKRWDKVTKSISIYDSEATRRLFFKTFRSMISRYGRVTGHAFDVTRKILHLVFDDRLETFNLRSGEHRRLTPPFRSVRSVLYHGAKDQLLVVERLGKVALYDASSLRLLRLSAIDSKACRSSSADRYLGGFDLCEVVYRVWPTYDYQRFFPHLLPVRYPSYFILDRARRNVVVMQRTNAFINRLHTVPLSSFKSVLKRDLSYTIVQGPEKGNRDYTDTKTIYALDPVNRMVIQVSRGTAKRIITPKDFRKTYNYIYAFKLDEKRSRNLRSLAALKHNPEDVVLVPKVRVAFVSHQFGSYITRVPY